MNYAPKSRTTNFTSSRTRSGMSLPVKIVIGLVCILAIVYSLLPHALPMMFLSLASPLWKADAYEKLGNMTRQELQSNYESIVANTDKQTALATENNDLKNLLGRVNFEKPVVAVILKRPPYSAYDSFILDVGTAEGLTVGNKVYALGNIPIGEIKEVTEDTSRVELYSSKGQKFDVLVGPSSISATAYGLGGGTFLISLPRDTKIKQGDQVLVPTLGNGFIGMVDGVASEASEPFARVLFHEPVNIYEGRFVVVDVHSHEEIQVATSTPLNE